MDTIHLEFRRIRIHDESFDVAAVFINGEELIALLTAFESPFAKREGHPDIAGAYSYLPKQYVNARMHAHEDELDDDDRVAVLECDCCGFPGCWPLKVRITMDDDTVIWSDFRQPHRSEDSAAALWDYQGFGPFVFDRNQYKSAGDTRQVGAARFRGRTDFVHHPRRTGCHPFALTWIPEPR